MNIKLVMAPVSQPPFDIDAIILEEDTGLVLSADFAINKPVGSTFKTMMDLWRYEPRIPGSVTVSPGQPMRILAVVHDLDQEETCTHQIVEKALTAALARCDEMGLEAIAMQPLGCVHGRLEVDWLIEKLQRMLDELPDVSFSKVWLQI